MWPNRCPKVAFLASFVRSFEHLAVAFGRLRCFRLASKTNVKTKLASDDNKAVVFLNSDFVEVVNRTIGISLNLRRHAIYDRVCTAFALTPALVDVRKCPNFFERLRMRKVSK